MRRRVHTIAAIGLLGTVAFGIGPLGCGSRLGPVRAIQNGGIDRANFPDITVEHAKDCVAEYAPQLEPGYHVLNSTVLVNEDGDRTGVTINDIPNTAPDFGACLRKALADMPVSEDLVRKGAAELKSRRDQASAAQRSLVGSPGVVVAGVVIVVSELVLEAGAYTIMFAVTVKVVEKVAEDVAEEGWKAVCIAKYAACIAAVGTWKRGNHLGASRCNTCLEMCRQQQSWPSEIGNGSCEYWKRNWK